MWQQLSGSAWTEATAMSLTDSPSHAWTISSPSAVSSQQERSEYNEIITLFPSQIRKRRHWEVCNRSGCVGEPATDAHIPRPACLVQPVSRRRGPMQTTSPVPPVVSSRAERSGCRRRRPTQRTWSASIYRTGRTANTGLQADCDSTPSQWRRSPPSEDLWAAVTDFDEDLLIEAADRGMAAYAATKAAEKARAMLRGKPDAVSLSALTRSDGHGTAGGAGSANRFLSSSSSDDESDGHRGTWHMRLSRSKIVSWRGESPSLMLNGQLCDPAAPPSCRGHTVPHAFALPASVVSIVVVRDASNSSSYVHFVIAPQIANVRAQ